MSNLGKAQKAAAQPLEVVEGQTGEPVPDLGIVGMVEMYKSDLEKLDAKVVQLAQLEQQAHDERLVLAGKAQCLRELIAYHTAPDAQ